MNQSNQSTTVDKTKLYYKYYNFVVIVLEEYPEVLKKMGGLQIHRNRRNMERITNPSETEEEVTNTVAGVVAANTVAGMVAVLLTTILPKIDNKLLKKLNELKEILKDPVRVNFIQLVMSLLQIALQVFHNVSGNNDGKGIFEIWNKMGSLSIMGRITTHY